MQITLDILYIHKENGEEITQAELNELATKAFNRFNRLIPMDIESVTTGVFKQNSYRPLNYCGTYWLWGGYYSAGFQNLLYNDIQTLSNIASMGG